MSNYVTRLGLYLGSSLGFLTRRAHDDTSTMIAIRRVVTDSEGEHVQIEVKVTKNHAKRTTYAYGHVHLSPEQADKMALALTKAHPKWDGTYTTSPRDDRERAREFYGLTEAEARDYL